jgi:DNA repair exonuclease SbcCD ATPase subunit
MKREEIKAIFADATEEQLNAIMSLNGKEAERNKKLESELKEKNEQLDKLSTEFETLKNSNAGAEEYKSKYEALVAENEAKAKQAEAERIAKERADSLDKRFEAVVGGKEFTHDAIRADYRRKFESALSDKANEGQSDADVFHALTKDDAAAFKGVTVVKLAGGKPTGTSKYSSRNEIMSIKDGATRRAEMLANPHLFPELNNN